MTDPAGAAVTASQHVDAPPQAVWHALTDGDTLARWWAAGDAQPVVGHAFTLDMGGWGAQACEATNVDHGRRFGYRFAIGVVHSEIT